MGICGWILFGFIAGLIARAIFPGDQRMGFVKTTLLGVGGSLVGGVLSSLIFGLGFGRVHPAGLVGSVIGAMFILGIGEWVTRPRANRP